MYVTRDKLRWRLPSCADLQTAFRFRFGRDVVRQVLSQDAGNPLSGDYGASD